MEEKRSRRHSWNLIDIQFFETAGAPVEMFSHIIASGPEQGSAFGTGKTILHPYGKSTPTESLLHFELLLLYIKVSLCLFT